MSVMIDKLLLWRVGDWWALRAAVRGQLRYAGISRLSIPKIASEPRIICCGKQPWLKRTSWCESRVDIERRIMQVGCGGTDIRR